MLRAREELRKIGQKQRARVSNLNSWSNNTQKLPNSFADSNYYLDQDNAPEEDPITEDQKSKIEGSFQWPNTYWFIAERTNGRLAMIGFMAVIINYTLFGWIAYPIL